MIISSKATALLAHHEAIKLSNHAADLCCDRSPIPREDILLALREAANSNAHAATACAVWAQDNANQARSMAALANAAAVQARDAAYAANREADHNNLVRCEVHELRSRSCMADAIKAARNERKDMEQ